MPAVDAPPVDPFADPLIGQQVGSFRVERRIGEGGMGTVYELVQPAIGKRLALKVLHPHLALRPEVVARFFDEARAVNRIRHPNIVDVLDVGRLPDGRPCLTMELLVGESLAARLAREGRLPPAEVAAIARQVADAIAAAHRAGVVHRDLKPENVHLVAGDELRVKVLDFGIARLAGDDLSSSGEPTRTGAVLGTPAYMAPEQALGRVREIDARSDVYALGVMVFEMLSGALPYRADSPGALVRHHASGAATTLATARPDLPAAWAAAVDRAMAPRREARFASMDEVVAAFDALGAGGWRRGARRWATIGIAALAALGSAAAVLAIRATKTTPAAVAVPASLPEPGPEPEPEPATGPEPATATATEPATEPEPARAVRPRGTLHIAATPWAEVTIDGVRRGVTPLRLDLAAGRHSIVLTNPSVGRRIERRVTIRAGDTLRVSERL